VSIKFWGVRGSIPSPGPETVRYGGNTSCVEVRCGSKIIILDAGTGLRKLGMALLAEFKTRPLPLTLLLSHTHWDHIQGLPFFAPLYEANCRLNILGCEGARKSLVAAVTGQMESPYFPVAFAKLPSNISIQELKNFDLTVGAVRIRALRANHPGLTVGYRLKTPAGSLAFFPDTEPRRGGDDRAMLDLISGVDVLILDSQYDRAEYATHTGWGHGCVDDSVALALKAGVKKLILFHHDPDHSDKKIDAFVAYARKLVVQAKGKLVIEAAREGMTLRLRGK
jgi:phosphoribosyl 1,2-cyclic phosphodiesterase